MSNPNLNHPHPPHFLTDEQKRLAHDLVGTCTMSNPQWFEDLIESGSKEALLELDDIVFCCAGCGWWCAAEECNELDAEWFCDDCAEDRKES